MSVRLYMDHHVKASITRALRDRGIDVITAADDGTHQADDPRILQRATELERSVFTQDDDFLAMANEWLEKGQEFSGIIYAHPMGITIGQAIRDLELIAKVMEAGEMQNRIVFIPLG